MPLVRSHTISRKASRIRRRDMNLVRMNIFCLMDPQIIKTEM